MGQTWSPTSPPFRRTSSVCSTKVWFCAATAPTQHAPYRSADLLRYDRLLDRSFSEPEPRWVLRVNSPDVARGYGVVDSKTEDRERERDVKTLIHENHCVFIASIQKKNHCRHKIDTKRTCLLPWSPIRASLGCVPALASAHSAETARWGHGTSWHMVLLVCILIGRPNITMAQWRRLTVMISFPFPGTQGVGTPVRSVSLLAYTPIFLVDRAPHSFTAVPLLQANALRGRGDRGTHSVRRVETTP